MFATVLVLAAASLSLHVSSVKIPSRAAAVTASSSHCCAGRTPLYASFLTAGVRTLRTRRNEALPWHSSTAAARRSRQPSLLRRRRPCTTRFHPTTDLATSPYRHDKPAISGNSPGGEPHTATAAAGRWLLRRGGTAGAHPVRRARVADAETARRAGGYIGRLRANTVTSFPPASPRSAAATEAAARRRFAVPHAGLATAAAGRTMDPVMTTTVTTAEERPLIGTHSGTPLEVLPQQLVWFHADEVLATVMLLSLPEYKDARLLRSRDPAALAACNIVVDVGAEYSPAALRFDHHQKSFNTTFYDEEKTEERAGVGPEGKQEGGEGKGENTTRLQEGGAQRCEEADGKLRRLKGDGFVRRDETKKARTTGETGAQDKSAVAIAEQQERKGLSPKGGKQAVTKLSSAGLIYKHFGKRLLAHRYGITDADTLNTVYRRLYRTFVEAIDAIDNGVSIVPGGGPVAYRDSTNLSSRIAQCNPPWNIEVLREKFPDYPRYHPEKEPLYPLQILGGEVEGNIGFRRAMILAAEALDGAARGMIDVWLPARNIVAAAVKERYSVHPSGQIIKLERWCPFEEHLFLLEKEMNVDSPLCYCLYPEIKEGKEVGWRIRAVGVENHMLESRLPLSARFCGLRDTELGTAVCSAVEEGGLEKRNIKPEDFIHCHQTGFIAGATTLDAALALGAFTMKEAALAGSSTT